MTPGAVPNEFLSRNQLVTIVSYTLSRKFSYEDSIYPSFHRRLGLFWVVELQNKHGDYKGVTGRKSHNAYLIAFISQVGQTCPKLGYQKDNLGGNFLLRAATQPKFPHVAHDRLALVASYAVVRVSGCCQDGLCGLLSTLLSSLSCRNSFRGWEDGSVAPYILSRLVQTNQ